MSRPGCPRCGGYFQHEPGGGRCLYCGNVWLYVRILPRRHEVPGVSGWDWRNRIRQMALDSCLIRASQSHKIMLRMLERLYPEKTSCPTP